MNVLGLFSGIGGFELGLQRAGFNISAMCEIEPYCRSVLRKHWPGVPIFEDVRTLTAADVPGVDIICGGFPCQPYSRAGKRLGGEDDRALWPEYRRLIEELRPSWVIGENVIGFVELGMDSMLDDLEALGYTQRPFDIPACAVGADHERRRAWIVAHNDRDCTQERINVPRFSTHQASSQQERGADNRISTSKDASYHECGKQSLEWPAGRIGRERESISRNGNWVAEIEPCLGRSDDGIPGRLDRLKALGNAVVPQIPEIIGRAIMQAEGLA